MSMFTPYVNKKYCHLGGQASWAKMMSCRGKLTVLACNPTKKVNKAVELTYLSKKHCVSSLKKFTIKNCQSELRLASISSAIVLYMVASSAF